jgi:hypothetical protein
MIERTLMSQTDSEPRDILLTLSRTQFEVFAHDLRVLRDSGAESNTKAIIDAVHERAAQANVPPVDSRAA